MDQPLLVALLIGFALLALWLWFMRGQDRRELSQVLSEHTQLRATQAGLQAAYTQTVQDRDVALGNLNAKQQQYVTLESRYNDVNTRLTQLNTQHTAAQTRLAERQTAHEQLAAQYTELEKRYLAAQQTATDHDF